MDIFKFINPTSPTKMEQGEIINGLTSKMWIEKYAAAGEFTFVSPASSGIREKLPIGSFVSHLGTKEIMIVENHEINDDQANQSTIKVTGRGFETFFENRIVGANKLFPISGNIANYDYTLTADQTWDQIVKLIKDHIDASMVVNADDVIPFITVTTSVTGSGVSRIRKILRGDLYTRVSELLSIDKLGIKVIRPNYLSPLGLTNPDVNVVIHRGVDRSSTIIFSYDTGEIVSADYLWSNKKKKNAALITGKWVETVVNPVETGYERRTMFVPATDIDEAEPSAPSGATLAAIVADMQQRGIEALAAQHDIALIKAEVSKQATSSRYRTDFDVGDLITVLGNYNEASKMRISEFVEIEDENGSAAYPTLTLDYEV